MVAVCMAVWVSAAVAREPDGKLGLIRTPNNGMPVLVAPGGEFDAVLAAKASLALVGEATIALQAEWSPLPGNLVKAHCSVPASAAPSGYALQAVAGDRVDRNSRAVFVRESFPDAYTFAQLTDTHVGSDRGGRPAVETFKEVLKAISNVVQLTNHEAPPAFAIITGDLTENGEPAQFQQFLEVLDMSATPTFVCPGNHDRTGRNYENVFGPVTYVRWFGLDGFLFFDTKDFLIADELGAQDADLYVFRRLIRSARWSIGVTHRCEADMGMRSQLELFVDDPLDLVVFGHWHRDNKEEERGTPWGTTAVVVTAATCDGHYRLFDVSPKGVKPRPTQRVPGSG